MKLCVCLGVDWRDQLFAYQSKAELIELRLDLMFATGMAEAQMVDTLVPLLAKINHKVILTCRVGTITQEVRHHLFLALLPLAPAYIDVEYDTPEHFRKPLYAAAQKYGTGIIASYHNGDATPELAQLCAIADNALLGGAHLVKIVTHSRDHWDESRLLSLYQQERFAQKITAFCMGRFGLTSRLHAAALGAPILYVAPDHGAATAPGQPCFTQFTEHLLNLHRI